MPISRALLNRLRLPYKALDIQGSKGDVLYIPDDVGVDLSVIHGVHNGDMVPIKSDADGNVSVAIDSIPNVTNPKTFIISPPVIQANHSIQNIHYDTSQFINYRLLFLIANATIPGSNLVVSVFDVLDGMALDQLDAFTIPITSNGFSIIDLTEHKDAVSFNQVRIQYNTSVVATTAGFRVHSLGWN